VSDGVRLVVEIGDLWLCMLYIGGLCWSFSFEDLAVNFRCSRCWVHGLARLCAASFTSLPLGGNGTLQKHGATTWIWWTTPRLGIKQQLDIDGLRLASLSLFLYHPVGSRLIFSDFGIWRGANCIATLHYTQGARRSDL
jgi:hypothetical protein